MRNLNSKYLIYVQMDGTLSLRERGTKYSSPALPVFSTETEDKGNALIQLVSALNYDGRQVVPGFLDRAEDIGIEAIFELEKRFETFHVNMV